MDNDRQVEGTDRAFHLDGSLSHLLHRAQQMAATKSAAALKSAGITLRQFSVLAAASQEVGPSQSRLVELTGIDRSTLADMLLRMEQSGLIERVKSAEDARAKSVSVTEKGSDALDMAAPSVLAADDALISVLAKNRRSAFVDLLTMLIDAPTSLSTVQSESDAPTADTGKKKTKDKTKVKAKEKAKAKAKAKIKAKAKDREKPKEKRTKKKKSKG